MKKPQRKRVRIPLRDASSRFNGKTHTRYFSTKKDILTLVATAHGFRRVMITREEFERRLAVNGREADRIQRDMRQQLKISPGLLHQTFTC